MNIIAQLLISFVISTAVSLLFRKDSGLERASLEDFSVPTATHDRSIPALFGTCLIRSPNVVYYGCLRTKKIKAGGLFGIGAQTVGFRYFLTWEYVLCHGEIDEVRSICIEERELWNGSLTGEVSTLLIDDLDFFGGKKSGGGVFGNIRVYSGTDTQPNDAVLDQKYKDLGLAGRPRRKNLAVVVHDDFEVGNQPRIPLWGYETTRYARGPQGQTDTTTLDSNPIWIIYELLTKPEYGGRTDMIPKIDEVQFQSQANQCFIEELFLSFIWDRRSDTKDLIREIVKTIESTEPYVNPDTNLIEIRLIRNNYTVNQLPIYSHEDVLSSFSPFTRLGISDLVNQVTVRFKNRDLKYKNDIVQEQNLGNRFAQQRENAQEINYKTVKDPNLARRLASRDIKRLGTPLSAGRLCAKRDLSCILPGDPFRIRFPKNCVEDVVYRAAEINEGGLGKGQGTVKIDVVEDVFGLGDAIYDPVDPPAWVDPCIDPIEFTKCLAVTSPSFICKGNWPLVFVCEEPGNQDYEIYTNKFGTYAEDTAISELTPCATLNNLLPNEGPTTATIDLTGNLEDLVNNAGGPGGLQAGFNLTYIGDDDNGEWVGFDVVAGAGNTWTISNVYRGLLDTVPIEHPAGTNIWFASYGIGKPITECSDDAQFDIKLVPSGICGELDIDDIQNSKSITMRCRGDRPWPAGRINFNGAVVGSYPVGGLSGGGAQMLIGFNWANRDNCANNVYLPNDAGVDLPNLEYTLNIYLGTTNTGVPKNTYTNADFVYNNAIDLWNFNWDWAADGCVVGDTVTFELLVEDSANGKEGLYPVLRTVDV